jgi:hypothetical protein
MTALGRPGAVPVKCSKEVYSMNIFYRPNYQSEASQFIDQLKLNHPELAEAQHQGHELLWNKSVDRSAWCGYRAAQVKQKPYVYQTSVS